jgi:hypothetical protein
MMAEIHREEAGRGAETGIEADEGKARGQPNRCAVKGGEAERGHRRVREGEKDDDHPFIVLTETKFSFRCIPVWIGTLL